MRIEKYLPNYKESIQNVCISQSSSRFKGDEAKKATLALYCDEYIEKEIAFLLVNDEEKVVGYILCAPDLEVYKKNMVDYLPILKENDEEKFQRYYRTLAVHEPFYQEYPAHLHIDLLEEYTGGGNGTKLMTTLINHLKEQKVPGVMITIDPNNIRALNFYKKMGFTPYDDTNAVLLQKL